MRFLYLVLLLSSFSVNAERPVNFGVFIAPKKVIADHQSIWSGIHLNKCVFRDDFDPKLGRYFCDVSWDLFPEGTLFTDDQLQASLDSLPVGNHIFSGAINLYDSEAAGALVESQPFREIIISETLDVDFVMKGLPLDPFGDNVVYIESEAHREHQCIFYDGPLVSTPIEKIEEGKLFCNLNWINIPTGFEQARPTNPTMMAGNLDFSTSDNPNDYTFIYQVKLLLPYEKTYSFDVKKVDAAKSVVNAPEATFYSDDDFFFRNSLTPVLPVNFLVANDYQEAMKVKVLNRNNAQLLYEGVYENGEEVQLGINTLEHARTPGSHLPMSVSVEYESKISSTLERNIDVVNSGMPNPILVESIRDSGDHYLIDFRHENDTLGATYRVYLKELDDDLLFLSSKGAMVSSLDNASSLTSYVITSGKPATLSVPKANLSHTRYALVSELLGAYPTKDDIVVLRTEHSKPIVSSFVSSKFNHRTIADSVTPVGSWLIVSNLDSVPFTVIDESYSGSSLNKFAENIFRLDRPGRARIDLLNDDGEFSFAVKAYSVPEYELVVENYYPSPNQEVLFSIENPSSGQLEGLSETIYWYVDGVSYGKSATLSISFPAPGKHTIGVYVSDDTSLDSSYLAGRQLLETIHVQLSE